MAADIQSGYCERLFQTIDKIYLSGSFPLQALQLLEFLVKNGSERVIDDARSHISLLRMLRQFQYIDDNGKDQGVNVRNRSQELAKLLSDVDAIRAERKKARANRNKFGGIEGGMGLGGFSGGSRMGGFGSDDATYGGYSGGVYGDGGGFGGNTSGFQDSGPKSNRFEEYDENDDAGVSSNQRRSDISSPSPIKAETKRPAAPKEPEQDLFSFGDEVPAPAATLAAPPTTVSTSRTAGNARNVPETQSADDNDDFNDFQSATPSTQTTAPLAQFSTIPPPTMASTTSSTTQFAAPKPVLGTQGANLNGLVGISSLTPTPTASGNATPVSGHGPNLAPRSASTQNQLPKPTGYQAVQPNYFTSVSISQPQQPQSFSSNWTKPNLSSSTPSLTGNKPASAASGKSGGDAFGSLWSAASANAGLQSSSTTPAKGPNLASMAKEKASAGIWGTPTATSTMATTTTKASNQGRGTNTQSQQRGGSAIDDLLG
jgi:epsin